MTRILVYCETTGNVPNDLFELQKTLGAGQTLYKVSFAYSMYGISTNYGESMGYASVSSSADGTTWSQMWSKSGNQGYGWKTATAYATGTGHTYIRFR